KRLAHLRHDALTGTCEQIESEHRRQTSDLDAVRIPRLSRSDSSKNRTTANRRGVGLTFRVRDGHRIAGDGGASTGASARIRPQIERSAADTRRRVLNGETYRAADASAAKSAVTIGVLGEILLVIVLCVVELWRRNNLRCHPTVSSSRQSLLICVSG